MRATASRSSGKRSSMSAGAASTHSWLPRRSRSQPSREVRQRIATSTSWSTARRVSCACASPVAIVGTRSVAASSRSAALRRASPRSYGRCSSTKKLSLPKIPASRAAAFGSRTASPCRAQPDRQTSPSCSSSSSDGSSDGGSGSRPSFGRVRECAAVSSRQRFAYPCCVSTSSVTMRAPSAAEGGAVFRPGSGGFAAGASSHVEGQLRAGDRPDAEVLRRVRELERAVDAVVVGERERRVAELRRPRRQLLRLRGPVEERVGAVGVQLDVAHPPVLHEHTFVFHPPVPRPHGWGRPTPVRCSRQSDRDGKADPAARRRRAADGLGAPRHRDPARGAVREHRGPDPRHRPRSSPATGSSRCRR